MSTADEHLKVPQNRFSFQHFDQASDFGFENSDGERIRKRKRPGRKSNPPSLQERRAQNRTAQKAFREREQQRKQEKERQWQDYSKEIESLRKELATVKYEAKYLKACVLHLTLACLIYRGSVPHIWTESRIIPSNKNGEYKKPLFSSYDQDIVDEAYHTPALLDMLLEDQHIVDFDKALFAASQKSAFSNFQKTEDAPASYQTYIYEEMVPLNQESQKPSCSFPKLRKRSKPTSGSSASSHSTVISELKLSTAKERDPIQEDKKDQSNRFYNDSNSSQILTVHQKPVVGVTYEPPSFKSSDDVSNMPPLQALHILRLQLKLGSILGSTTPAALLPTALQRVIPHDVRIDYIPGASIRDSMIIFQGYYNVDDCFQSLIQNTVFMGGDVRDTRNWVISPEYSMKFWFLSHQLVDQSYDECLDKKEVEILVNEYFPDDKVSVDDLDVGNFIATVNLL